MLPYSQSNPYQTILSHELEKLGIDVCFARQDDNLWTLSRTLPDSKKTVVHLHWTHVYLLTKTLFFSCYKAFMFFHFIRKAQQAGHKLVWTVHNLGEHEKSHPHFELFCHQKLAALSDKMIVHSKYAKQMAVSKYKLTEAEDKIHVVPHGNYIGIYPNTISRKEARESLGLATEGTIFLFFGQVRSYKGVPELLHAFSRLNCSDSYLVIAGKPVNQKERQKIIALAAGLKNVKIFLEFIPDNKIQCFMNAADVVVFPFQEILTSGSLLLAMSYAKAVILPEMESFAEFSNSEGTVNYPSNDRDALCRAMEKALHQDLASMGKHNRQMVEPANWGDIAAQTAAVYREALSI